MYRLKKIPKGCAHPFQPRYFRKQSKKKKGTSNGAIKAPLEENLALPKREKSVSTCRSLPSVAHMLVIRNQDGSGFFPPIGKTEMTVGGETTSPERTSPPCLQLFQRPGEGSFSATGCFGVEERGEESSRVWQCGPVFWADVRPARSRYRSSAIVPPRACY